MGLVSTVKSLGLWPAKMAELSSDKMYFENKMQKNDADA